MMNICWRLQLKRRQFLKCGVVEVTDMKCSQFAFCEQEKSASVSTILFSTSEHDHGEGAYKRGELSLRNNLKRVFNETCREDPFRNMI